MKELEQKVLIYNDSEPISVMWDGQTYELSSEPVAIERGIAEHWVGRYPALQLRVEESEDGADIEGRTPVNPLEANDRGEAFAALKRPRKKASGE